ncbi:hypothetical protein C0J52_17776 [Blattella germanica]|nr:hypothetical protein C0J52_17776 [Blattella germanica]
MQSNMASARKKQDEKHLKILRELVSLTANKQCFDCNQRGPTYINMTIGSFVCTSCSGMLRGLTPPHRVKSISMASFSPEEVELIKSRGNEYCRRIWLGLYDANHAHDTKDEQQPSAAVKNNGSVGFSPPGTRNHSRTGTPTHVSTTTTTSSNVMTTTTVTTTASDLKPLSSLLGSQAKTLTLNVQFLADFGSSDPFSSSNQATASTQPSFANFENNPIFNSSNDVNFGFSMNSDSVPPRYNTNRWSMPTSATLSTMSNSFSSPARKATSTMGVGGMQQSPFLNSQGVVPTANNAWSVNGPSIMGATVYGSPSQTGFLNAHAQAGAFADPAVNNTISTANPFTGTNANSWVSSGSNGLPNSSNPPSGFGANPFRTRPGHPGFGMNSAEGSFGWSNVGVSGMPNGQVVNGGLPGFHPAAANFPTSQSMNFPAKTWHTNPAGNPFVLGASPAPTVSQVKDENFEIKGETEEMNEDKDISIDEQHPDHC